MSDLKVLFLTLGILWSISGYGQSSRHLDMTKSKGPLTLSSTKEKIANQNSDTLLTIEDNLPLVAPIVLDTLATSFPSNNLASKHPPTQITSQHTFVEIAPPRLKDRGTHTQVHGQLAQRPRRSLKLVLYAEPIHFREVTHLLAVNSKNHFELNLHLLEPTIGHLYYGKESVEVYIEPGDKLFIAFDPNNFASTVTFEGRGASANLYLKARQPIFQELDAELSAHMRNSGAEVFSAYMKRTLGVKRDFLRKYRPQSALTKSFKAYAKADIDYWHGYNLLNYPWEHPLHQNQESPLDLDTTYYDFLEDLPVDSESALPHMYYTYFLDLFFDHLKAQKQHESHTHTQLAVQYLQDRPLNYFKAKQYVAWCQRGEAKRNGSVIEAFVESCPYDAYTEVVRRAYDDAKGLLKGEVAPEFTLVDQDGKRVALSDFRGQLIYLDFWATWCQPCVHALDNSKEWKKQFANQDVVFIYVALDRNERAWRNFIHRQGIPGIHLIADTPNVYEAQIARLYKIKQLPTVLLIDKTGKIHFNSDVADSEKQTVAEMIRGLLWSN
ncbi:MAG: TlpA disulfide reductase family protein [Bacteroidota bacterium]